MIIGQYWFTLIILIGINMILALSFYLPFSTGLISLSQAGFMAIGAYSGAILTAKLGYPPVVALLAGGLMAGAIGIVVALPALRIKGIYLLLLTIGFNEIVRIFFLNFTYTGGVEGFYGIPGLSHPFLYVYGTLAVLLVIFSQISRSPLFVILRAIRHDEDVAAIMGVRLLNFKVLAFGGGAFIAGMGGFLLATYITYLDPPMFNLMESVMIMVFVIFGGFQTYYGAIFGAAVLTAIPELFRFIQDWRFIFLGIILILTIIFRPSGVITKDMIRWGKEKRKKTAR